ncbi:MAG TPA: FAD-binding oxidoreductase [Ilumatobacteraceae bacterium]|nr:FAD-binding oxidoreductase [Ilumatobacteraceae bacterium]
MHPTVPPEPSSDASPDDAFDVVVIGAGIAGAAAAWSLAGHLRVVLVEREAAPGMHATGRSASVLSETSGHPVVCMLARASRPFFERPPDGVCETPLLAPRGLAWVGQLGDAALLDSFAEVARQLAPTVRRLTPAATLDLLPGFRPVAVAGGAVHEPDAMSIDTAALLQSFVGGTRRRGSIVLTTSEAITAVHTGGSRWVVTVGERELTSTHVVNAGGAWGDVVAQRCGVAPIGLQPMRRTAAIVPAPEWVSAWPLVMDIAGRYYVEPEAGGLLVSPADETASVPCDARAEEIDVAIALDQLAAATEVPVRSVRRAWAGLRTFAPDRVPVLGEDPDAAGFWWLVGQGGAGIKTSPALAALLTAQLTGSDTGVDDAGVLSQQLTPRRFR